MAEGSSRSYEYKANRLIALERDGYMCMLQLQGCTGEATEADHRIAVSKGGTDEVDNLQAACRNCNNKKSSKAEVRTHWVNPKWL
jgi:5-methylcytosine-specific restriction protein A